MIISHKHGCIFIKNKKVAGTSIEVFLGGHCGPDDVVTDQAPLEPGHLARNDKGFSRSESAVSIREKIGASVWDNYYKFCVERNPWDKTLSHYHMTKYAKNWKDRDPALVGLPTFDMYLKHGAFPVDFPRYTDADGKLLVDKVCRYETLAEDLAVVFQLLGIPFDPAASDGGLGVRAKSEYRTDRRPCCDVYTPEQAAVIAKVFEREIAMFGYTLQSP